MNSGDLVYWSYFNYENIVLILSQEGDEAYLVLMLKTMKKAAALKEELIKL